MKTIQTASKDTGALLGPAGAAASRGESVVGAIGATLVALRVRFFIVVATRTYMSNQQQIAAFAYPAGGTRTW